MTTEREWRDHYNRQVAKGRCPYSGATIRSCQRTDVCDCNDFPEVDRE